jgi:impB/mucB/samB family C-terminal domain
MLLCINVEGEAPDRILWEEMLDVLDAVSPLVEDASAGRAFLDMHGVAGSVDAWVTQTRGVLARFGIALRVGAGANKIAAYAAARLADGSVWEPGSERRRLAPLPLRVLEIEPEIVERLRLLGIERLGELAALAHGPFVRRFGVAAARWHELARGIDNRPFVPRPLAVAIEAAIFGEGRAADEAQVLFALRMLLARICTDLERCGKRAGALHLAVELEDAEAHTFDVPLALPTAHERSLFELLRAKLEGATFNAPIVGLRLAARQLEEGGEAQALFGAGDLDPQKVAVTIARLEAVLGCGVTRAQTREAHVLEERFAYEPFTPPAQAMFEKAQAQSDLVPQLRLLTVREVPVQLRGGEPAIVDRQAVRQCVGPWRIDERAYTVSPVTRDEYDVVLEDGTFARIYRQNARWYLRGVYE